MAAQPEAADTHHVAQTLHSSTVSTSSAIDSVCLVKRGIVLLQDDVDSTGLVCVYLRHYQIRGSKCVPAGTVNMRMTYGMTESETGGGLRRV